MRLKKLHVATSQEARAAPDHLKQNASSPLDDSGVHLPHFARANSGELKSPRAVIINYLSLRREK